MCTIQCDGIRGWAQNAKTVAIKAWFQSQTRFQKVQSESGSGVLRFKDFSVPRF